MSTVANRSQMVISNSTAVEAKDLLKTVSSKKIDRSQKVMLGGIVAVEFEATDLSMSTSKMSKDRSQKVKSNVVAAVVVEAKGL